MSDLANDDAGNEAAFNRARNAISSARQVSAEISSVLSQCREICASDLASVPPLAPDPPQPAGTPPDTIPDAQSHGTSEGVQSKLYRCQIKLTTLKEQHESTLTHLLKLRLEQLLLRQSQLSALRALLQSQLSALLQAPLQNTRAAINSALSLISDSLVNLGNTFQLINSPVSATTILELVEVADKRADDVSRLARRLLNFLQSRSDLEGESTQQGADEETLQQLLPHTECSQELSEQLASEGQSCPICLANFAPGETVTSLACQHLHHFQCLFEWLRLRACCPVCKENLVQ